MLDSPPVNASTAGSHAQHQYVSFNEFWLQSSEFKILQILQLYVPPILIVFGSIGNVLAFVVLTRKHMRHSSICFYMAMFAITNTIILYIGCGLEWVAHVTNQPYIANLADWTCKVWQFLFNVIRYSSFWLVVAMTADRVIRIWHPNMANTFCTVFMAKAVTISISVGLVVVSVHSMWIFELIPHSGCTIDPKQRDFETTVWPWIAASLSSYIPTLFIMILTILLVIGVYLYENRPETEPNMTRFTRVTLCLAIFFLICTLPTQVINFIEYSKPHWLENYQATARLYLIKMVCQVMACFYTSVCFVFYFLLVPAFRADFCLMAGQAFAKYPMLGEEATPISDLKKPIVCEEFCTCQAIREKDDQKSKV